MMFERQVKNLGSYLNLWFISEKMCTEDLWKPIKIYGNYIGYVERKEYICNQLRDKNFICEIGFPNSIYHKLKEVPNFFKSYFGQE